MMNKATEIVETLAELRDEKQRIILMRFFKTGPGQYGEGDQFFGIKVPAVRALAKMSRDLPLESVTDLLVSEWHEVRLCGFLILTYKGGMEYLEDFLDRHAATMPRTALRYAIEQLPEPRRQYYLKLPS